MGAWLNNSIWNLRFDQEIEKRTGADVGWVFDVEGEDGYGNREEKVINELTEKQGIMLATGEVAL